MKIPSRENLYEMLLHLRSVYLAESERTNQIEIALERLCIQADLIESMEAQLISLGHPGRITKSCVVCQAQFDTVRLDARYCCSRCRSQAWRERQTV